jgi:hypothetical protein
VSKKRNVNFRMFPGRLPQSWRAISHGAQGLAFHWWRVFEAEVVRIPVDRLAAALGLQPEVRRHVVKWVSEMLDAGTLVRDGASGLRMPAVLQSDSARAPDEPPTDVTRTPDELPTDSRQTPDEHKITPDALPMNVGRTPGELPTAPKYTESGPWNSEKGSQIDREIDREIEGATKIATKGRPERHRPELEAQVSYAFERRNSPRQGASQGQWQDGCKRVQDALDQGHFPDALSALEALAVAAVDEALRPGGKLGFALQQATFAKASPPKPKPEDLKPKIPPRGTP